MYQKCIKVSKIEKKSIKLKRTKNDPSIRFKNNKNF